MFNFNNKPQDDALDEAIDDLLTDLKGGVGHDHDAHNVATENLIKLMKLKKELNPSWRPSPDALIAAATSLGTVLLILHYEKLDAITSKALSFVGKLK